MSSNSLERIVHGTFPNTDGTITEVVRYDRAGKLYFEPERGKRRQVTLAEAADALARTDAHYPGRRYGGTRIDAEVRRRRTNQ